MAYIHSACEIFEVKTNPHYLVSTLKLGNGDNIQCCHVLLL